MIARYQPPHRPTKPAPNAPGTLGQQFAAIVGFLSTDLEAREADREGVWEDVQDEVVGHRRGER